MKAIICTIFFSFCLNCHANDNLLDSASHMSQNFLGTKIKRILIKKKTLSHDHLCEIGSVFTSLLCGATLHHSWIAIETHESHRWFIVQFSGKSDYELPEIEMLEFSSEIEVDQYGGLVCRIEDSSVFTYKYSEDLRHPSDFMRSNTVSLGDLIQWMRDIKHQKYNLICFNCQHLCDLVFDSFTMDKVYSDLSENLKIPEPKPFDEPSLFMQGSPKFHKFGLHLQ